MGCIPFVAVLARLGVQVGANWEHVVHQLKWLDYAVVVALFALVAWFVARIVRRRSA